ncbi:lantibiotic dehydratase [Streptomyces sp. CNQ-509]|uniref:lantibiotic dehydratase n=1 Tax=Streptomyces sp. CNQ-509 TaxID=444103 RepID=UPI00069A77E0|nr:lantibiotic dehydratase [Streptomyces sp. CNQ-509]
MERQQKVAAIEHTRYFRPQTAAMWRASTYGSDKHLPPWPGEAADAASWRSWLASVWTVGALGEAVTLASPSLADRIDQTLAGQECAVADLRHMATSLARYLIRLRGRATPFGTFAGVGSLRFGDRFRLSWKDDHRLLTRVDAVWLADIIARLEACPSLRERLPVVVNNLAFERGEKLVVPWQPHLATAVRSAGEDVAEVTVRRVPVVHTICQAAGTPVAAGTLAEKTAAEHPGASRDALMSVVGQLMASGVLISSLRALGTCTDPLGWLLSALDAAGAAAVPEVETVHAELRVLHHQMSGHGQVGAGGGKQHRRLVKDRMRALSSVTDQPLAVDLSLDADLVLPRSVAMEAADAAQALIRLTPQPSASTSWREYHHDFLARYGPGTLVPVIELTDSAGGLGYPRHFTVPSSKREFTPRDEALLSLAHQAALDGVSEIVLEEADLERIGPAADSASPVSPADLSVDLRARSHAALSEGEFTLAVSGFGRAGATTGRFLDLLEERDRGETTALYPSTVTGVAGAMAAQLSYPPRHVGSENVLRVMPVLPHVISLAEHRHGDGHLPLTDLAVAADTTRLYVVSRSQRRVVEPMLPHAGARHTMPDLARLLFEIPRSTHPAVTAFDWGAAACLPYLPRACYGRSILAPAQWRIDPSDLPGPKAPAQQWAAAWQALRHRRQLPSTVAVADGDRRLRLDLDQTMDWALLRSHLQAADGPVTVAEAPNGTEHGWCGGRAHEIVIPLAPTAPPAASPSFLTSVPPPVADSRAGGGVLFAKLYGPSGTADDILTRHLSALLTRWTEPPKWWFVRYRHPCPHLRLRVRDADTARAAGHLAAWAGELRQAGLAGEIAFDTYRPETGRYGAGESMNAAEHLFAADSAAVLAQLAFLDAHREIPPQALTAASMADLAAAIMGGRQAGLGWLLDHPQYADGAGPQDRQTRGHMLRLAHDGALETLPGGSDLAAAWAARTQAAAAYTARLTITGNLPAPATVLGSLLHLHHVRAHVPGGTSEATTYKLARAVALAGATRHTDRQHREGGR